MEKIHSEWLNINPEEDKTATAYLNAETHLKYNDLLPEGIQCRIFTCYKDECGGEIESCGKRSNLLKPEITVIF